MLLSKQFILAAATGVASHNCIFIHGEWHMQAPVLLRDFLFLAVAACIGEIYLGDGGPSRNILDALLVICTYAVGIFASIVAYRTLFHRLKNFPGPWCARVSKFWHAKECIRSSSQNHLVLDKLHSKYGDFVRTGGRTSVRARTAWMNG